MKEFPRTRGEFEAWNREIWERIFSYDKSRFARAIISWLIGTLGFGLLAFLFHRTGSYYASVLIMTSILITVYGGLFWGVALTIVLSLLADYLYIPPLGSVFDNRQSFENFLILVGIGLISSFFVYSIKTAFHLTLLAERAEQGAERAKREMQKSIQARDEMLGVISHELKNPLTSLQSGISLIQRVLPREPGLENVKKLVERLIPSILRMNRMISDLLDVTRLEAKALILELRTSDLSHLTDEVIKSHESVAQEKLLRLRSEIPPECRVVFCDPDRTIQILSNLVNNSIKFTNFGGSVRVEAERAENWVEIRVIDTGKGIPEEFLSHVFDRFWQAKSTAYQGTGLGLAIVKGLVESQGGRVWVESQLGRGSVFHFTLRVSEQSVGANPRPFAA